MQRRPEFETLESMTLLSGLAGVAVSAPDPKIIHLAGTLGLAIEVQHHHVVSLFEKGAGSIHPLGHVTEKGDTDLLGFSETATLTLRAKNGKLFVSIGPSSDWGSETLEYTITGGTKAYAGATGSGSFQSSLLGNGKFTVTFS
jgi:hypothetical protein